MARSTPCARSWRRSWRAAARCRCRTPPARAACPSASSPTRRATSTRCCSAGPSTHPQPSIPGARPPMAFAMLRLTLKARLLLGFAAVLMLPTLSAVFAYLGAREVREHTQMLSASHYPVLEATSRVASRVTVLQAALERACGSNDVAALDHARAVANELEGDLGTLQGLADRPDVVELRGTARTYAHDAIGHCAAVLAGGQVTDKMRDEVERDSHFAARLLGL